MTVLALNEEFFLPRYLLFHNENLITVDSCEGKSFRVLVQERTLNGNVVENNRKEKKN